MGQLTAVAAPGARPARAGQRDVGAHRDGHPAFDRARRGLGVGLGDRGELGGRVVGHRAEVRQDVRHHGAGRDQDSAGLAHRVAGLIVQVGAVLDGAHAGPDRRHDARLAVAVRGDHPLCHSGDLHDHAQFRVGELLVNRIVDLRQHAPRCADLDDLRVAPQLLADRPGAVVRPVGQAALAGLVGAAGDPRQRVGVQIAVASRGAQDRPRAIDGRPGDRALGDRPGQVHAEPADLADGGDSGLDRRGEVPGAPCRPQRDRLQRKLAEVEVASADEVPVAVPHAGHHRLGPVDGRAGGGRRLPGRAGVADHRAVDDHHRVADRFPAAGDQQFCLDALHDIPPTRGHHRGSAAGRQRRDPRAWPARQTAIGENGRDGAASRCHFGLRCLGRARWCAIQEAVRGSQMPPTDMASSPPGAGPGRGWLHWARRGFAATPLPVKVIVVLALFPVALLAFLLAAPWAVVSGSRSPWATASVALAGTAGVAGLAHDPGLALDLLLVLPAAAAVAAHAGTLGWWLAKAWQDSRQAGRLAPARALGGDPQGPLAPGGLAGQPRRDPAAHPGPAGGAAGGGPAPDRSSGRMGGRAGRGAQPAREPPGGPRAAGRAGPALPGPPAITVEEAMAELDSMIGLAAVKEQVRSIAASIEAARRRALAGIGADKPMQHFVFLGPPGTGKTTVARIVAKVFYAFGLLESPAVVEAQRSDLVGEYLGATAIKTNELVDSALGGVLFIDEAYSLVNEGDGQGDRFGSEAVQALLKRAEDDRDRLVIILAGYERQMESFLASNPGLASRFALRIKFSGYSPGELLQLADLLVARRGELIDPAARPALWRMLEDVGRRRLGDELGNGRFVRSLVERAGQARDVRVMAGAADPAATDLITLRAGDLERAYADLTSRFRGYDETPTLESALAELDALVGLDPVKRQVREIAAQLRVARLRDAHGLASRPPARHFVFTGPPGTGKTTVARILARIFAALGLLVRPAVIEAHRADLVGDHLGATAIKTNKLVDSALGGVLFIDEAYSLHNEGYAGGDAFGAEAIATLLKRAEDDRDRLVIVLAGYTDDMSRFLRTNPGLASRFSVRIAFPSYGPADLVKITSIFAEKAGDTFAPDAMPVLTRILAQACEQGRIDELGNGRFARSLFERACAARDLRVAQFGELASAAELTTISAADLEAACSGLRG